MTGSEFKVYSRSLLRAVAPTAALIFGLGGLQFAWATGAVERDAPGPVLAQPHVLQTDVMSLDPSQVIWIRARNQVQWFGANTPRPAVPSRNFTPAQDTAGGTSWVYDTSAAPRQGLYLPPEPNEFTSYCYENDFIFQTGTTGTSAPPRLSRILDVVTLAGDCKAPPVGVKHLDFCFRVIVGNPTYDFGVLFTFWDDFDINGGFAGGSVVANAVGGVLYNFGPITAPGAYCFGGVDTNGDPVSTLPVPVYFDDPLVGVEMDYVNGTSLALGTGGPIFAFGPPRATPDDFATPPVGSSDNFYYRDADLDGVLTTADQRFFSTTDPGFKANLWLHMMGFQKPDETEPNNSLATADTACLCSNRTAAFDAAGDVDWVKFNLAGPNEISATLDCGAHDTIMTLRDGLGGFISSNDDISGTNLCSEIHASLGAGDYFLEIHDKGDNEAYAYDLILKPLAARVSNLKYSTTIVPAPKSVLTWDPQGGSTYDVVRGNITTLHNGGFCDVDGGTWAPGDFTSACALPDCWSTDLTSPTVVDITNPVGPADSLFYIVRAKNSCQGIGSYDEGGNQDHPRDAQILANASANPCP